MIERALILSGGGARGAFQVGVLKYLKEIGWEPDLIVGSSVGALNAVAIGSGLSIQNLEHLWLTSDRPKMFKYGIQNFFLSLLSGRKFEPALDTTPLENVIRTYINFDSLHQSSLEIIITTINMLTSQLHYFSNSEIEIEHIMASTAMPLLFPYQSINGEPHWDGGVIANTPVMPAIERNAKQIIVVLLSPIGAFRQKKSIVNKHQYLSELLFEHFLIGSYNTIKNSYFAMNQNIGIVSPEKMLGLRSLLNFSIKQAKELIKDGYINAKKQLTPFFQKDKT